MKKELELFFDEDMIPHDSGAVMQFAGEWVNIRDFYWNNSLYAKNTLEKDNKSEEKKNSKDR